MPRLRINDMYAQILRGAKAKRVRRAAAEAPGGAVAHQEHPAAFRHDPACCAGNCGTSKNFFSHGEIAMRPLVLREIADTLGLHESTISRVTTNKYMATPMGTFELKYFFGSHVSTRRRRGLIHGDPRADQATDRSRRPQESLSDSRIAELLGEQGFVVARRTVAKYREALKIPAVNLRKTL
jgi:RNA polymerase sigma-54 factor